MAGSRAHRAGGAGARVRARCAPARALSRIWPAAAHAPSPAPHRTCSGTLTERSSPSAATHTPHPPTLLATPHPAARTCSGTLTE